MGAWMFKSQNFVYKKDDCFFYGDSVQSLPPQIIVEVDFLLSVSKSFILSLRLGRNNTINPVLKVFTQNFC